MNTLNKLKAMNTICLIFVLIALAVFAWMVFSSTPVEPAGGCGQIEPGELVVINTLPPGGTVVPADAAGQIDPAEFLEFVPGR